jgi:hypothetical protein
LKEENSFDSCLEEEYLEAKEKKEETKEEINLQLLSFAKYNSNTPSFNNLN